MMMLKKQQSILLDLIFSQHHSQYSPQQDLGRNLQGHCKEAPQDAMFESLSAFNKGLAIYKNSLLANASRALAITFATLYSLLGKKKFDYLVKVYLQAEFKQQYDWGEFGDSFSSFIAGQTVQKKIGNASLLSAVAKLDFACHQCERSENSVANLDTLNLLTEHDAYHLKIKLSAGMQVISSGLPLDEFMQNITQVADKGSTSPFDDIELIMTQFSQQYFGEQICRRNEESSIVDKYYYLVWRPRFQAQYVQITLAEFDWFSLWLTQRSDIDLSIGTALDKMDPERFSLIDWLPNAIEQQQISAIYIDDQTKEH
jgi:hypothetical protein